MLRHDPELAAERAARAAERRGVWIEDCAEGVSEIRAVTDTPDAAAFDAALNHLAATLGALGDQDPVQVRRARAVGVLADPQYALELLHASTATGNAAGPEPEPIGHAGTSRRRRSTCTCT